MSSYILGHYAYWASIVVICVGMYGILFKKNLLKKLIGLSILQAGIIQIWVCLSSKWGATVPVKAQGLSTDVAANYLSPLPHCLMLTAIVVGIATMGVAFALLMAIHKRYGTLDESEILSKACP